MAIAVTLAGDWLENLGNRRAVTGSLVLSGTYATNGYSVTAANVGLGVIEYLDVVPPDGYVAVWDRTNSKVKLFWTGAVVSTALAEVTNGTAISATVPFKAFGR